MSNILHIKDVYFELPEKCKGKVPDYVYEGMLNYKIEID